MTGQIVSKEDIARGSGGKILAGDPRLEPLLDGVTATIRRYCGWHIAPVIEETITVDGNGGYFLRLPTLRCVEVSSLKIVGKTVDKGRFGVSKLGMIELYDKPFPNRFGAVEVTFRHGFDSAPDVGQVIQQVLVNAFSSPMGVTREQAGQLAVTWSMTAPGVSGGISLLKRDRDLLASYRLEGL